MIRITHPRPQAGRQRALGVEFVDGFAEVAELHPVREQALTQHGFQITETVSLEGLTVSDLRDIAAVEGVDLPKKAKRAAIIAAINKAGLEVMS